MKLKKFDEKEDKEQEEENDVGSEFELEESEIQTQSLNALLSCPSNFIPCDPFEINVSLFSEF